MRARLFLGATAIAAIAALPAAADNAISSLRCSVAPAHGGKLYAGYLWVDLDGRRAYARWYPPGAPAQPPVVGPFGVSVIPNRVSISENADPRGRTHISLDRDTARGTIADGHIYCDVSKVALPIPLPPLPKAPAKR